MEEAIRAQHMELDSPDSYVVHKASMEPSSSVEGERKLIEGGRDGAVL